MRVFFARLMNRAARMLAMLLVVTSVVAGPAAIATATPAPDVIQPVTDAVLIAAVETEHEVKMGSDNGMLAFVPKSLTISPGDTVDWVINKVPPHNVVFDTAPMDTAQKETVKDFPKPKLMIAAGDTYTITFPADAPPGRYPYYCTPHRGAGMVGEIVVQ